MPQLDEVKATLLYSEVYGQIPTPRWVKTLLGRTNKGLLLTYVCSLSAIMHANMDVSMEPAWQVDNIMQEFTHVLRAQKAIDLMREGRIVFHEPLLGLMARYALAFGCDGNTIGDLAENVLRLALSINELYLDVNVPFDTTTAETRASYLKLEIWPAVIPNERLAHVVQRYYRFFRWIDGIEEASVDWLPLRADFQRLLEMTPEEYLACAMAMFSRVLLIRVPSDLRDTPPQIVLSEYVAALSDRTIVKGWVDRFGCSKRDLVDGFEPSFSLRDIAPFVEKPLLVLGDDTVCCPMPSLLEDTLNTRLYFTLYAEYEAVDGKQAAEKFSRLQARFLESYVGDLVRLMVGPEYETFGEISYRKLKSEAKSTDVVAVRRSDGCSAFIEVTKTRFHLAESLFAMDERRIFKDIEAMLLGKAEQMQKRIDDLGAGLFHYSQPVTAIAPVVVTGQAVPGLVYLKHYVFDQLRERNVLQNTVPLLNCDVEELEMLAMMAPGKVDLYALLAEKATHPDGRARLQPLKNYLYYYRPDLSRQFPRDMTFPEFRAAVNEMVAPVFHRWGVGDGGPIL